MRGKATGIIGVLLFTASATLGAQLIPSVIQFPWTGFYVGAEIQVNTSTTDNQKRPAVAAGPFGTYLVVWNSDHTAMGFYGIYGQLFDRDGAKIGSEFQIDQAGAGRVQYTPDVAWGGNAFNVVWADFTGTVLDSETWFRRLDLLGAALGDAVQVNVYTTGHQRLPRVDADDTGGFIVWESNGQDLDGLGVYGRQFNATGTLGPEILVNSTTMGNQDRPSVAVNASGATVVFRHNDTDLAARDLDAAGNPLGLQRTVFMGTGPYGVGDVVRLGPTGTNTLVAGEWNGDIWGRRNQGNPFLIAAGSTGAASGPRLSRSWDKLTVGAAYTRYGRDPNDPTTADSFGRQYRISATEGLSEVDGEHQVNTHVEGNQWVADVAIGKFGEIRYVYQSGDFSPGQDGDGYSVFGRNGGHPKALRWDVDARLSGGSSNLNFLWEINERVSLTAGFSNESEDPLPSMFGTLTPAPPPPPPWPSSPTTVIVNDSTAAFGDVPGNTTVDCHSATGDCYEATVTGPRPGPHWDETLEETLSTGVQKQWVFHIGESFADVPTTNPFYAFIENLFHNGVTAGGACGGYCPTDGVKRQQMAVFLLKARFGKDFTPPPASGTIFGDVPVSNPFAPWIEVLYLLGVTGGCQANPLLYCPDAIVNRQQMAVFLLKTKEGSTYDPPDCAGIFTDVPCTPGAGFSDWIEELYNRQITGGCVANPLQYCPANPTNRQQMAAFLVKTFELLLYGP